LKELNVPRVIVLGRVPVGIPTFRHRTSSTIYCTTSFYLLDGTARMLIRIGPTRSSRNMWSPLAESLSRYIRLCVTILAASLALAILREIFW
jgi:hypothetical protein